MTEPKKASHQVNIIRITELLPHTNADSLALVHIGGYQLVVRKDQFKVGDLAAFVQPDSVVPQTPPFSFIWEEHVGLDGTVPERRRRITVRKFRKEWSEGLLLPVSDFPSLFMVNHETAGLKGFLYQEGDDVSDILGVTHYDPDTEVAGTGGETVSAPKRKFKYPRTLKGWTKLIWFYLTGRGREATVDVSSHIPTYDVEALKNYKSTFEEGEPVVVTEKIHGSNARFIYLDGVMYAGSKNQWKSPKSNSTWTQALKDNQWIEEYCRANEGYALYGEVCPTQKGFDYGSKKGEVRFFAFDIYTPQGEWMPYDEFYQQFSLGESTVPLIYKGPYDAAKIATYADGPSWVPGAKHIREGVVIESLTPRRVRGLGRAQLKLVSREFYLKDEKA